MNVRGLVVNYFLSSVVLQEILEISQQFRAVANETVGTEDQKLYGDKILGVKVDEFEELAVMALVVNMLASAIEECELVGAGTKGCCGW